MKWEIVESGPKTALWNMEEDRKGLEELTPDTNPVLRFYEWAAPSVTYGYFVDPWDYFDQKGVESAGLDLARRPTGGGILFHEFDISFSIIVPASHPFYTLNSLHSYEMIHQRILKAIQSVSSQGMTLLNHAEGAPRGGFCMAKATVYDILLEGKKVGGAAQRKTKQGLLHQGSLSLKKPDLNQIRTVLKPGSEAMISKLENTSHFLGDVHKELKARIIQEIGSFQ